MNFTEYPKCGHCETGVFFPLEDCYQKDNAVGYTKAWCCSSCGYAVTLTNGEVIQSGSAMTSDEYQSKSNAGKTKDWRKE